MRTNEHIRKELGVSGATISNWVKTGIIPNYPNGEYFDEKTYECILNNIRNNFKKLRKRANRSNNSNSKVNSSTISNTATKNTIETLMSIFNGSEMSLSLFMFNLSLFFLIKKQLVKVIDNQIVSTNYGFTRFLSNWNQGENGICLNLIENFSTINFPEDEVDFLGSTYESLRTIKEKSNYGAFFTPRQIISDIDIPTDASVLDPCAGTGTFLLSIIKKEHLPNKITIRDIDNLALNIAKVNFALFFNQIRSTVNIEIKDILLDNNSNHTSVPSSLKEEHESFDIIVTNPPYGLKITIEEKKKLLLKYPEIRTTESFSIALYNCINKLSSKGKLYFVLPESFLYIDTHLKIRSYVFGNNRNVKITHYGNAFKGVMSKIIRLDIDNSIAKPKVNIFNKGLNWTVKNNALIKNSYRPAYISNLDDLAILNKILKTKSFTLEGKCRFGLGIVTGNNGHHLNGFQSEGFEAIYTGKELQHYKFLEPKYFINFIPEVLQQVAPIELYRQPKICYRFISDSIKTVADLEGYLILNSVNFFIPPTDIPIKSLSAFLNCDIVTFIYQRLFNSTKVLKNHIENIPIPETFFDIIDDLEILYKGHESIDTMNGINMQVCKLYGLSESEANYIRKNI